jgi:hypothetical protein
MQTGASSRSFGLLIAGVFFVLAGLSYWAHGRLYPYWGGAGAVFLAMSILVPRVLAPLKRLWIRLGHVLHVVVGPVVLGLSYVIAIIPVGLLTRMFGKDLLAERWDRSAQSYWHKRPAGGPAPESLRDQF